MKKVLTIAGSDSGGGAGIQADLKTFQRRGVYGMSAITALTAQNTLGVEGIYPVSASFVKLQIDTVMKDIGADCWKTGMLLNSEIITIVAKSAEKHKIKQLVVDPVMVAKGGSKLLKKSGEQALIRDLLPICLIVTPNHHEAEVMTGQKIRSITEMKKAAFLIHKSGARNIIIKGGDLPGSNYAIDILFDGRSYIELRSKRIISKNTHGTGCTFASVIAAEIAKGKEVKKAAQIAKRYITERIKKSVLINIGHGHGPLGC
ncbi:bifunctional hydroxymethylpyrimidine kinase/phosphomethylpyrimidine kinase [Candidatus Roizmanbacteria bacterium RIFCSPLOWO2_02_FULL_38_10]|uniref:hydroxymethylpyrimidine kinase n=1 Tax=Candidatus Roizmanbacteria bacterium RIFCSPLOWO2_02_FULL_38_10 TaxID=1802074 RepID=A0A1F7JJP4_9BACT|nr:MAG: bifunctional hydroxymethylpyrimidine kinase/phosphomethylpyrimidine kinase [Candidatus Roizmanbacteria bacterium RIFCSPLOWO2_02_FULL_38_10]